MGSNVVLFSWNRSIPGREQLSGQHFQDFLQYLTAEKEKRNIDSFEAVLVEPYGGSFNGFFLVRGEPAKLNQLVGSTEWVQHITRGIMHLEGAAVLRGVSGAPLMERMGLWTNLIPKSA